MATGPPAPAHRRLSLGAFAGAALLGLFALLVGSTLLGPASLPPLSSAWIFFHQLTGGLLPGSGCPAPVSSAQCAVWTTIVWNAYVPAILLALAAGAALALSGGALQGVFRNPLADPYLLGLSAGAALGAAATIVFRVNPAHEATTLSLAAFLGGIVPGLLIYLAATWGRRSTETLILTGVALSAFFAAILSTLLLYNPNAQSVQSLEFWLLGSLTAANWTEVGIVTGVVLTLGTLLVLLGREINLLQLGPDVAQSLGVRPRRVIQGTILLSTAITATAVAFTGIIGFIGLVAPHIVRRLAGTDYRIVLPFSAVFGGIVLLAAWDVSDSVIPHVVIPVGIPTAFIGAPFLIYLLYRYRGASGTAGGS